MARSKTVGGLNQTPRRRGRLGAGVAWAALALTACAPAGWLDTYAKTGALQQAPDGDYTVTAAATVLNRYGRLGAATTRGAKQLTLSSAQDFADLSVQPGDLLLLMQPQGAQLQTPDSDQYGGIAALNSAGLFEFVAVAGVDGTTNRVLLDAACGGLRNSYDPLGAAQVVRVPQYGSLTVNAGAAVVGLPWNGQVGGVVAVRAQNRLTVNGEINASGQGFRGGPALPMGQSVADESPDVAGYVFSTGSSGGAKGESIAGFTAAYMLPGGQGRGAPANGGGGGNAFKAGGGGGAGAGAAAAWTGQGVMSANVTGAAAWALDPGYKAASNQLTSSSGGGRGGYSAATASLNPLLVPPGDPSWQGNFRRERGGRGGHPLALDSGSRLYFGGGGGAGDQNGPGAQATTSGSGGAGGGLVYLLAGDLQGTGRIAASGAPGTDTPGGSGAAQGAGGGGGGGAVILNAGTVGGTLSIEAQGGDGGRHQSAGAGIGDTNGPGGGGGGGFIALPAAVPASVLRSVRGGTGGTSTSAAVTAFPSNGATAGGSGSEQVLAAAAAGPVCTPADFSVSVATDQTELPAGSAYTYTVIVTNRGPYDAAGVRLHAALSPAMSGVAWSCASSDGTLDAVNCADLPKDSLGDINKTLVLPALANVTFTVYVTLDPDASGAVTYQATVTPPAYLQDQNPANDTASVTTQVTQPADVQVQLLAAPNPSLSGEAITLTATVRNVGPLPARDLQLTLKLPPTAQLQRPPSGPGWTCSDAAADGTVLCTNPVMADGTVSEVFWALLPEYTAESLTASASATAAGYDPVPTNNAASVAVPIVFNAASFRAPAVGGGGFGCGLSRGAAGAAEAPAGLLAVALLWLAARRATRRHRFSHGSQGR